MVVVKMGVFREGDTFSTVRVRVTAEVPKNFL